jgi:hypothetical protein
VSDQRDDPTAAGEVGADTDADGEPSFAATYPLLSAVVVAAVATVSYAGIQVVSGDPVAVAETAGFVVVFTAVYAGGRYYLADAGRLE